VKRLWWLAPLLAGCGYREGALDPASAEALTIAVVWWIFLATALFVFLGVLVALAVAFYRGRARAAREGRAPELEPERRLELRTERAVATSSLFSVVVLIGLLVVSIVEGRELFSTPAPSLRVKMTARQWWWEIQYQDPRPDHLITTANELYLPIGTPVDIELSSADVIHSLWIPNLHGKRDLIPGHKSHLRLVPNRLGRFEGHCAEFCGLEHARMELTVTVQSQEHFAAWQAAQRTPARVPTNEQARRGAEVFVRGSCHLCHSVAGTSAAAAAGPDLTHVASRAWLAAGALQNSPQNLRLWVTDPQRVKPGAKMPPLVMPEHELDDLLAYVGGLE
jgi:cytochrome c oxidase subunit 2